MHNPNVVKQKIGGIKWEIENVLKGEKPIENGDVTRVIDGLDDMLGKGATVTKRIVAA